MFPNSLRYIAPLFPSRILSPLLPSLRLPSFNFLSLRFIDSYGFSRNYHEIPYNYEQKYEQKYDKVLQFLQDCKDTIHYDQNQIMNKK